MRKHSLNLPKGYSDIMITENVIRDLTKPFMVLNKAARSGTRS